MHKNNNQSFKPKTNTVALVAERHAILKPNDLTALARWVDLAVAHRAKYRTNIAGLCIYTEAVVDICGYLQTDLIKRCISSPSGGNCTLSLYADFLIRRLFNSDFTFAK